MNRKMLKKKKKKKLHIACSSKTEGNFIFHIIQVKLKKKKKELISQVPLYSLSMQHGNKLVGLAYRNWS